MNPMDSGRFPSCAYLQWEAVVPELCSSKHSVTNQLVSLFLKSAGRTFSRGSAIAAAAFGSQKFDASVDYDRAIDKLGGEQECGYEA